MRSACGEPAGHDLVENEEHAASCGHLADRIEPFRVRCDLASGAHDGLYDHAGDFRSIGFDHLEGILYIVEGHDQHVLEGIYRYPSALWDDADVIERTSLADVRIDAGFEDIRSPVITALGLDDLVLACESPRCPHRVHGGLGAGIAESHEIKGRIPADQ